MNAIQKMLLIPLVVGYVLSFIVTLVGVLGWVSIESEYLGMLVPAVIVETAVAFFFLIKNLKLNPVEEKSGSSGKELDEIINNIDSIIEKLRAEDFKPDLVLCFHRSAAIASGILASRNDVSVRNLVCLGRDSKNTDKGRDYCIGRYARLNRSILKKKVLVVFFMLDKDLLRHPT